MNQTAAMLHSSFTSVAELLGHKFLPERVLCLHFVGFDAAHKVWKRRLQLLHQFSKRDLSREVGVKQQKHEQRWGGKFYGLHRNEP